MNKKVSPHLGLLTIAGLTSNKYKIRVMDEFITNPKLIYKKICNNTKGISKKRILVGISVVQQNSKISCDIASYLKKKGLAVVIGGVFANNYQENINKYCSSIIIGEVERIWKDILSDFEKGKLKKKYIAQRPSLENSPMPRYDLVNRKEFLLQNVVQTGRGCKHACDFCVPSAFNGAKSRHKTIKQIIKEIKYLKRTSKGFWKNKIIFTDDNIINDKKFASELFKSLIPLKIRWGSQCPIDIAEDEDLLKLAYKSGCRIIYAGLESVNQDSLKSNYKSSQIEKYKNYIRTLKRNKILLYASFMYGLDNDRTDSFSKTTRFCVRNNIDFVTFSIFNPEEGTRIYEELKKKGRISKKDLSKMGIKELLFEPKYLSAEDVEKGTLTSYLRFYSIKNCFKRIIINLGMIKTKYLILMLLFNLAVNHRINKFKKELQNIKQDH